MEKFKCWIRNDGGLYHFDDLTPLELEIKINSAICTQNNKSTQKQWSNWIQE